MIYEKQLKDIWKIRREPSDIQLENNTRTPVSRIMNNTILVCLASLFFQCNDTATAYTRVYVSNILSMDV